MLLHEPPPYIEEQCAQGIRWFKCVRDGHDKHSEMINSAVGTAITDKEEALYTKQYENISCSVAQQDYM